MVSIYRPISIGFPCQFVVVGGSARVRVAVCPSDVVSLGRQTALGCNQANGRDKITQFRNMTSSHLAAHALVHDLSIM